MQALFSPDELDRIGKANVLVVGAGGIGCELLKNLVYSGINHITVVDLDTIDVSNLNRQFLFRPEHVGRSKAEVAAEVVRGFNPSVTITPHFGNVKDPKFGVGFIKSFNIVLNGLDNVEARRHVNRLCLAADVLLIDSGTTGYNGQVTSIKKGVTACYDCTPKPTQKVYPICTIRSTPDKPVHCIVWGKECFKLLFGATSESMLYEDAASGDESTYMALVALPREGPDELLAAGTRLLRALFQTEVHKRLGMDTYKNAQHAPQPLSDAAIAASTVLAASLLADDTRTALRALTASSTDAPVWSQEQAGAVFIAVLAELARRHAEDLGALCFDKDFDLSMQFVCAAANLRCRVFSIETLSLHDAKGVAGNIIPAIATTNAVVAGVQVLQAVKMLARPDSDVRQVCRHTYCMRSRTRKGVYLQPTSLEDPARGCFVCGTSLLHLQINTHTATLADLITLVLKGRLGLAYPIVNLGVSGIYEEGPDADEALEVNKPKLLAECPCGGIVDQTVITVSDFVQDVELNILVNHCEDLEEDTVFILRGEAEAEQARLAAAAAVGASGGEVAGTGKRKREEEDDDIIL